VVGQRAFCGSPEEVRVQKQVFDDDCRKDYDNQPKQQL
jgi:hypothetical protein